MLILNVVNMSWRMEEFGKKEQPDFKVHQTIHQMQLNSLLVIYFSSKLPDETKSFYVK